MLRRWYQEGINDGDVFRRRGRWMVATLLLATVATVAAVVWTSYSP
jgi:hypothetical protein